MIEIDFFHKSNVLWYLCLFFSLRRTHLLRPIMLILLHHVSANSVCLVKIRNTFDWIIHGEPRI